MLVSALDYRNYLLIFLHLFVHMQGVLHKVTTFGAGLLIGTALIIVIPEGMESLFGEGMSHCRLSINSTFSLGPVMS